MAPPLILFDYPFSPYAQKVRLLCAAAGIPYKRCEQPMVLPRPTLLELHVTYRRIPVLAVGKDIYVETAKIIEILQQHFGGLPTSPADRAYEAFADKIFWDGLACIPPETLSDGFVKDREPIFPVTARKDFSTLGPSGKSEFQANLDIIENDFLADASPFIGGSKPALADIHIIWVVRWILNDLGIAKVPGFGPKDAFPKIWKL
jgi:glutathione S-transferase